MYCAICGKDHGLSTDCRPTFREKLIKVVCHQLVFEHRGMREFTAGLNAKNVKPCECAGCKAARKLYGDKELGIEKKK